MTFFHRHNDFDCLVWPIYLIINNIYGYGYARASSTATKMWLNVWFPRRKSKRVEPLAVCILFGGIIRQRKRTPSNPLISHTRHIHAINFLAADKQVIARTLCMFLFLWFIDKGCIEPVFADEQTLNISKKKWVCAMTPKKFCFLVCHNRVIRTISLQTVSFLRDMFCFWTKFSFFNLVMIWFEVCNFVFDSEWVTKICLRHWPQPLPAPHRGPHRGPPEPSRLSAPRHRRHQPTHYDPRGAM